MPTELGRALRLTRHFGLRWWHTPPLVNLAFLVHGFETLGVWRALRGRNAGPTVYR
ncbi:MAG: hypothetical protein P8R42_07805 [Candidatus Binatia bacterium]|nr:hypothetical protein [Candidatus Binatia bacterium]